MVPGFNDQAILFPLVSNPLISLKQNPSNRVLFAGLIFPTKPRLALNL